MIRFFVVSLLTGFLFGVLDGLINANPLAQKKYEVFKPIAKTSINVKAGIVIDLTYGLIMGYLFLLLYSSLPGGTGLMKGISYALIIWFFRVLMNAVSQWMMYEVPIKTILYGAFSGLAEMLIIGAVYGIFLKA